ncbi:hypothetical protein [Novosphingobium rosa]|uniref:hypothetical protein n=1 Tax=Novosphingobium rosa TaxID=76978 RepID=UPI00082B2381|nr:hypothetical protein [Novosphingobium rosa]
MVIWFAALFGLSVVAIRGSLLESWMMGAQLDLIVPAAAPPLGMLSRLLIALPFAAVGGGIGLLAARLIRNVMSNGGQGSDGGIQRRSRDRHPDHPARRPISAHAELGDEGLGRADAVSTYDETPAEPYPVETFRSAFAGPAPMSEAPLAETAVVEAAQPLPFAVELPPAAPFTEDPFLEDQPQEALPIGASVAALPVFAQSALGQPALGQPAFTTPAMATGHTAAVPEILPPLGQGEFVPPLLNSGTSAPLMESGAIAPIAYPPPPPAAPVSDTPSVPYPAPAWEHEPQQQAGEETAIPVITPFTLIAPPQQAETQEPWSSLPPLVSDSDLEQQAHLRPPAPVAPPPSASVTPIRPRVHLATLHDLPIVIDPIMPEAEDEASEAAAKEPQHEAMIGATPVQPRSHAEERIGQAALDDLSHVELIERLALAMKKRDDQAEAQDDAPIPLPLRATPQGRALAAQVDELAGTQASLRSALAALREVK